MNRTMKDSSTAIGIDLGTTNSCVGVFRNGRVEIIANAQGIRTMPSIVSFTKTGRYIGESAKLLMTQNPADTIYGVKRIIGRKYKDKALQADIEMWPFRVVKDWGKPKIAVSYKKKERKFTPQEISAMILSQLKEAAEMFLEHKVKEAVITVPAYFNDSQTKATIDAGKIAGLKVLRVMKEPTAAAVAYGMDKRIADKRNILIYDFGGGTFDVSIITIKNGEINVRTVEGDNHLGGGDIDNKLLVFVMNEFKQKHKQDISANKNAMARLRNCCEDAKKSLSLCETARINIDNLIHGVNYTTTISRARFEKLNEDFFMKTIMLVQSALSKAGMDKREIQNVVLVGGSTRIPKVQSLLQEFFGVTRLNNSINPDEAVAYGAAVQAALIKGVNCEAMRNICINDVTPFSLGIEIDNGYTCVLIERNTAIPTKCTKNFPAKVGENEFKINICEGEAKMFKDNNSLGNIVLKGLPASAKGVNVEVTFELDVNGTLTVSAVAASFREHSKMTVTIDNNRIADAEITLMAQNEHEYRANDEKQRECEERKGLLQDYICNVESKIAEDSRKKISKSDKQKISDLCQNINAWFNDDMLHEVQDYEAKQMQLEKIWEPIARKLKL